MANQNIESLETEPSQACGVSSAFPSLSKLERLLLSQQVSSLC